METPQYLVCWLYGHARDRGALLRFLNKIGLLTWILLAIPSTTLADVSSPTDQWLSRDGGCLSLAGNPEKAEKIRRLALILFGRSDDSVGCVTFPYQGQPYDVPGINNAAHAGIDFRADGVPVHAVDAGRVVVKSLSTGEGHSTLIIENNERIRKTLYLHMSSIDVEQGDYVLAGQQVGIAGSVGACPEKSGGCPHLHFEVWPLRFSPIYCNRTRAISGSACVAEGGTCSLKSIDEFSAAPEWVIEEPLLLSPRPKRVTPSIPESARVSFKGVGDLRVGMSFQSVYQELQDQLLGATDWTCSMSRLQSAACGLSFMVQQGKVARVDVDQGNVRTVDGLGVGSTIEELREIYGTRLESRPNQYQENAVDVWVVGTGDSEDRSILFVVVDGVVASFRAGNKNAVALIEHCL